MTRNARSILLAASLGALAGLLPAADQDGFGLAVIVGGVRATEYAARGRIYVEALKGRDFVLRISNPTSQRIAVALSVDGRNVVDAKRTSSLDAAKWILAPGQTIDVPGWQVSGATARRFFFTETSGSYAKWLGDTANVGTIEAVFYREKLRPPVLVLENRSGEPSREAGAAGRAEAPMAPPSNAAPAEKKARASDSLAATGIGEKTDFLVEWVAFEGEKTPAARIALRYEFRAELVRLGVLPREDDLYVRDRAHGFEHDYAPDPFQR
jgi:hypothetical protein